MRSETVDGPVRRLTGAVGLVLLGAVSSAGVNLLTSLAEKEAVHRWRWPLTVVVLVAFVAPVVWRHLRRDSGPVVPRAVAAIDTGNGSMDVVVATESGRVLVASCTDNGRWSGWTDLGFAGGAWDVAAVVPTQGVVEYFVVDTAGVLHLRRQDRGRWSPWQVVSPGGGGNERLLRITAASLKADHREVYAVTENGRLLHAWRSNRRDWSDWYDAGVAHCVDVAACSPKDDLIEAFAIDRDGAVWHRWYWWDRWHDWENWPWPGSAGRAVTAFRKATDHQEMFVVGKAGDLGHRWHSGGQPWSAWATMHPPGDLVDIAAGTTSANALRCLGLDAHGGLWQTSFEKSGGWSDWRPVPGTTAREHDRV